MSSLVLVDLSIWSLETPLVTLIRAHCAAAFFSTAMKPIPLLFSNTLGYLLYYCPTLLSVYVCVLPVGACSLRCEVHSVHPVVVIIHNLRQAKVCDFDFSTRGTVHQQYVTCAPNTQWDSERCVRATDTRSGSNTGKGYSCFTYTKPSHAH